MAETQGFDRLRLDRRDIRVDLVGIKRLANDGAETVLSPGDVLIENGTRHRFRVVGDVPAVMASLLIGARRQ